MAAILSRLQCVKYHAADDEWLRDAEWVLCGRWRTSADDVIWSGVIWPDDDDMGMKYTGGEMTMVMLMMC